MDFTRGRRKSQSRSGCDEGREEGAAGSVDVDGDVEPGLGLQLVKRHADLVYRLELQSERDTECDDYADGVFVAALDHFFRREQEAFAFHGHFADFDIEVAAELVPADLDRAHDEVGASVDLPWHAGVYASST